jgi:hypothetical protein
MAEYNKIDFRHRHIREIDDITDIAKVIVPGNKNQQHAAARILLHLKNSAGPIRLLRPLEQKYSISRRTLERTRAKLTSLGLIEHVGPLSKRSNGHPGWRLSVRMSSALRLFAETIDAWKADTRPDRMNKDERLVEFLR